MARVETRGHYWMQATANATSYPAAPGVAGHVTATAGSSVVINATKVLIGTVWVTNVAAGTISIQNHGGTVTYFTVNVAGTPSPLPAVRLDIEIPSGFRVVSSAAVLSAIVTYLPLT